MDHGKIGENSKCFSNVKDETGLKNILWDCSVLIVELTCFSIRKTTDGKR